MSKLIVVAPHPNALMRRYEWLRDAVLARRLQLCDYHNWRGIVMQGDQVVLLSHRAIMHTQIVTPSLRNDYSWVYTQLHLRTKYFAQLHKLPG